MFDYSDSIKNIMTDVLGNPKRESVCSGGWYEYNCPCCSDENGGPDGKYNFAVKVSNDDGGHLYGHCWKCGYSGKLSHVIRKYGTKSDYDEYKDILESMKESRLYSVDSLSSECCEDFCDDDLVLPKGFLKVNPESKESYDAYRYLKKRGVDDYMIEKFNIGYIGKGCGKLSERIVIPSYDEFGSLNYWVARDYTGISYRKVINPVADKKKITFGVGNINWYEPVTIVEGPFDHIVVPNSIALLGKAIDYNSDSFKQIKEKSHCDIYIFLDYDALNDAKKMYRFLDSYMPGRIRIIECPDGYDASDYYRDYGNKGIIRLMQNARKLDDYELATVNYS